MSFVIKTPDGTYVREYAERNAAGEWQIVKAELVPKAQASSYSKKSEARKAVEQLPNFLPNVAVYQVEAR